MRKMLGKWCNGESSIFSNLLFNCTHQIFIHHRQSGALQIIMHIFISSLNSCTHLCTTELLLACFPYKSQNWRISGGFMFFTFKKWITDRISHVMGLSISLNIINTQHEAWTLFECLWTASVLCQKINNLGTHAHHHDCSAAVAILANSTYFLDNPRIW